MRIRETARKAIVQACKEQQSERADNNRVVELREVFSDRPGDPCRKRHYSDVKERVQLQENRKTVLANEPGQGMVLLLREDLLALPVVEMVQSGHLSKRFIMTAALKTDRFL